MSTQESQRLNISIQYLLDALGIGRQDAMKVLAVLASTAPAREKVLQCEQLNIKNLDTIIGALCIGMLVDAIEQAYHKKSEVNQIQEAGLPEQDIEVLKDKILEVALSIQSQLIYKDTLFLFLLIFPILMATGAMSGALTTEVTLNVLRCNNKPIRDLIVKSDVIAQVFLKNEKQDIRYN
jgi:hypothetical protein